MIKYCNISTNFNLVTIKCNVSHEAFSANHSKFHSKIISFSVIIQSVLDYLDLISGMISGPETAITFELERWGEYIITVFPIRASSIDYKYLGDRFESAIYSEVIYLTAELQHDITTVISNGKLPGKVQY